MVTAIVHRAGATRSTIQQYDHSHGPVVWGERVLQTNDIGVETTLRQALVAPAADPGRVRNPGERMIAADDAPFFSPEEGARWLDIGCSRILDRIPDGFAALLARDDDEAELLKAEGLMDWQIAGP